MNRIKNTEIIKEILDTIEKASHLLIDERVELFASTQGFCLPFGDVKNLWIHTSIEGIRHQLNYFDGRPVGLVYVAHTYSALADNKGIVYMQTFPINIGD